MPWQGVSPMDLRVQFVTEWRDGFSSMSELCAQYGVSRKTGYKWLDRFDAGGVSGLRDRSRRPTHSPQATDRALVAELVALRQRYPTWGATKLLSRLKRARPEAAWPRRSTVCDLLKAHGLVSARRTRHHLVRCTVPRMAAMAAPNETWTTDFKGQFRTQNGVYCYPLTLRDGFSRYVLRCDALLSTRYAVTRPCFERAFAEYGLPARIRSDNGAPFASSGFAGLSRLSVWWLRLGILLERTEPGHPEQNGAQEQFHRVLKAETTHPPAVNAAGQQGVFRQFRAYYNEERPHAALDGDVPADRYRASPRPLPTRLPAVEYPGHWEVRRVSPSGTISWRGAFVFLSEALIGEDVGLEEVDDGLWTIHLAGIALGRLDEQQRRVFPIVMATRGRSVSSAGCAPGPRKRE
jgi:putative transposase